MRIVPVCLGDLVPNRRPPLATELGWRDLARGTALCLGTAIVLAMLVSAIDARPAAPLQISEPQVAHAAKPSGKFGH